MDVRLESLFPSPVLHPGVVLRLDYLDRYGIPLGVLAQAIGVDSANLSTVAHGRRAVALESKVEWLLTALLGLGALVAWRRRR